MQPTSNGYFQVTPELAGKSLSDLFSEDQAAGKYIPRLDVLAQQAGVDPNAKLTAGQYLNLPTDTGSGEYKYLSTRFGAPQTASQYSTNQRLQAVQPAINTLNSTGDVLKDRYNKIIADIRSQKESDLKTASINAARDYAARGFNTNDTAFVGGLSETPGILDRTLNPIKQSYGRLENEAGSQFDSDTIAIQQLIANIQAQAGNAGISDTQALQAAQEQARQFNASNSIQQKLADLQAQNANKTQYQPIKIGNDYYNFNPSTGKYELGQKGATSNSYSSPDSLWD